MTESACQPFAKPRSPDAVVFVPPRAEVASSPGERDQCRAALPPSASGDSEARAVTPGFKEGDVVMVVVLQSRPELANTRYKVLELDSGAGRYLVALEDTGEVMLVKSGALRTCLFAGNFRSGDGS